MSRVQQEVLDLLNSRKSKPPYELQGHSWTPLKGVGKQYCKRCGLVALNNPFTDWCVRMGCNHEDHPQYEGTRRRLTKPNWME